MNNYTLEKCAVTRQRDGSHKIDGFRLLTEKMLELGQDVPMCTSQVLTRRKHWKNTHLYKFLSFGYNYEARLQTLRTPLQFEPGDETTIPEYLEHMVEPFFPWSWSS